MSKLTYIRCGDYDIPNLKLSVQPETSIGKYGRMRKSYLKEHRPILYNQLLMSEKLYPHLLEGLWQTINQSDMSRMFYFDDVNDKRYFFKQFLAEIGVLCGCSKVAVYQSVEAVRKKFINFFESRLNE